MRFGKLIVATLSVLLLASCVCGPVVDAGGVVRLPCCRQGEFSHTINISTGIAPWQVRAFENDAGMFRDVVPASNPSWIVAPHLGGPIRRLRRDGTGPEDVWARGIATHWVGPPADLAVRSRIYLYRVQFQGPPCLADSNQTNRRVNVSGWFAADDSATLVSTSIPPAPDVIAPGSGLSDLTRIDVTFPAMQGGYELIVSVRDDTLGAPTGLIVQATVTIQCGSL